MNRVYENIPTSRRHRKTADTKTSAVAVDTGTDTDTTEMSRWERNLELSQPWLVSVAVHILLLIILAVLVIPRWTRPPKMVDVHYHEYIGDNNQLEHLLGVETTGKDTTHAEEVITPSEDPLPAVLNRLVMTDIAAVSLPNMELLKIQSSLSGRDPGQKAGLLQRGGGNSTTQECVERALEWLTRVQRPDGGWSLKRGYPHGAAGAGETGENRSAATAMALLAFQGNGVTPFRGLQSRQVAKGWQWLLAQQDENGCFFRDGLYGQRFYTHGMCTIAICELYGMTRNDTYLEPAKRAVGYCLRHQTNKGGWRYDPHSQENDLSVTGWILMALQSARMAGIEVPQSSLDLANSYLDHVAKGWGIRYSYRDETESRDTNETKSSPAMTAEGLLCRMYLGWSRDDPRLKDGLEYLTRPENLIRFQPRDGDFSTWQRDVYYWYYATQTLHHAGAPYWKRWNDTMRQSVCEQQVKTGLDSGSWHPFEPTSDAWADSGGRLYVTCFLTYMLEVYYRHLPLYRNHATGYE